MFAKNRPLQNAKVKYLRRFYLCRFINPNKPCKPPEMYNETTLGPLPLQVRMVETEELSINLRKYENDNNIYQQV